MFWTATIPRRMTNVFSRCWLSGLCLAALAGPLQAQDWRDVAQARQRLEERDLEVRVRYGAGRVSVRPARDGQLFHAQLHYDAEKFQPILDYERGALEVGIQGLRDRGNIELRGRNEGKLDLTLSTESDLDLTFEMGAVRSDIELGGLRIERLELQTGASETQLRVSAPNPLDAERVSIQVGAADFDMEGLGNLNAREIEIHAGVGDVRIDLGGEWRQSADLQVEMGLGSLELRLPGQDVGVEILQDSFLTALDAKGLERRGGRYLTPGFERASRKVRVEIDAAFGKIRVIPAR